MSHPPVGLRGLIAATHTPLHADQSIAPERIAGLVEVLVARGVDGLYVLGSTGEGPSLSVAERRSVAAEFVRANAGRLPLLVQVGSTVLADARELAAHAAEIGADGVSAVFTSYFPVRGIEPVVEALASIAAAAPGLPFYAYHIPALSGIAVDPVDLLDRLAERAPNLAGLKFTAPQADLFQACVERFAGRLEILWGCDEMLLAGFTAGGRGAIGSTYNFAAPLYRAVLAALERADLPAARSAQARAVAMVRVLLRHGGGPAIKAAMGLSGYDCGPVRAPQQTVDGPTLDALRAGLEPFGLLAATAGRS
jgi:N-acetylneuraminate lyase